MSRGVDARHLLIEHDDVVRTPVAEVREPVFAGSASSTSYPEASSVRRIICRMCGSSSMIRTFMSAPLPRAEP